MSSRIAPRKRRQPVGRRSLGACRSLDPSPKTRKNWPPQNFLSYLNEALQKEGNTLCRREPLISRKAGVSLMRCFVRISKWTAVACTGLMFGLSMTKFYARAGVTDSAGDLKKESRVQLEGSIHPKTRLAEDLGQVDAEKELSLAILFRPTGAQQAKLDQLLKDLLDPKSSRYHHWITASEYAANYGLPETTVETITSWLKSKGAIVRTVSLSRNRIAFEASASQAEALFEAQFHRYLVDGKLHYANSTEATVPASIPNLAGIRGLNDFHLKPRSIRNRRRVKAALNSDFTSSISGNHYLAPDDFATIYDVKSLYNSGLDGTGQTIAIAGQTDILLTDIEAFRTASGLSKNDPHVVLDGTDPGTNTDDMVEADLDIEWSGAVAKGATIIYVNSTDVMNSFEYAITQNLAPVLSISYGACETNYSTSDVQTLQTLTQQANAQGMTIIAPAGDSGAADCDYSATTATQGLAVDLPASLPYVTGLGGTRFVEGSNASQYWNSSNNSSNGSALSYIPSEGWNDSTTDGQLSATGGGASKLFSKPTWQTGTGVPNDGKRDVPDVALNASADHDGYLVCSNGNCTNGYRASDNTLTVVGGTSGGSPTFAGIIALVNQKENSSQGNVNSALYGLFSIASSAFHDVTTGNNKVSCTSGTTDCSSGTLGYSAGTGYDQVTGIGSIDAYNLVTAWPAGSGTTAAPDFALLLSPASLSITRGSSRTTTASITAANSFSGAVSLSCSGPSNFLSSDCSISPSSVTGSGTASVTIGTQKAAVWSRNPEIRATPPFDLSRLQSSAALRLILSFGLIALAVLVWNSRVTSHARRLALGVCGFILLGAAAGCSSTSTNDNANVATGSYTFQITATSGTLTHSATLSVTVQ